MPQVTLSWHGVKSGNFKNPSISTFPLRMRKCMYKIWKMYGSNAFAKPTSPMKRAYAYFIDGERNFWRLIFLVATLQNLFITPKELRQESTVCFSTDSSDIKSLLCRQNQNTLCVVASTPNNRILPTKIKKKNRNHYPTREC